MGLNAFIGRLFHLTVANECFSPEVEPKHGRHVERGASLNVLNIGVSPCLNEQLHAESSVGEVGGVVERGLSAIVESIEGDLVLEQDVDHHVLAVVTGNVERSTAIGIDSIRLSGCNDRSKLISVCPLIYSYWID